MIRILKFLAINFLGIFSGALIFILAQMAGFVPEMPEDIMSTFRLYYFGGYMWCWVVGALLSVGYLLTEKKWGVVCCMMPLLLPVVYSIGVIIFYN